MIRIPSASRPGLRCLAVSLGLLAQFVATVWSPALAATAGADAVLVMDSSGSMAKNDPKKLRVPAAKMFMTLLRSEDRVALISFSDNAYPVLHFTAPSAETHARILASADKVSSKGIYTNLYAAVSKGIEMLGKEGKLEQDKMLVLMSDGKMDVGDSDEDRVLKQKLQTELLQAAKNEGVRVYTIAFTEQSDTELLRQVAKETGALFKLAHSDDDLHEVFGAIFESARQPNMLPIEGDQFMVDASIEEVTIVASKEGEDVHIYLQSPSGERLAAENAGGGLKWFQSHYFDMITLKNPSPGAWRLLSTGGRNRAYIVTDMALHHGDVQPGLMAGEDFVLESWLAQDGKLLDKEAVLTNTRFVMEIRDPEGETVRLELLDRGEDGDKIPADGVYSNTLTCENAGSYQINLIAESETFQRQKSLHFEVAPIPAARTETAPEDTLQIGHDSEERAQQQAPLDAAQEPEPAKTATEQVLDPELDPVQDAEQPVLREKTRRTNLVLLGAIFTGVNLLLAGVVFLVWWFVIKRKNRSTAEAKEQGE